MLNYSIADLPSIAGHILRRPFPTFESPNSASPPTYYSYFITPFGSIPCCLPPNPPLVGPITYRNRYRCLSAPAVLIPEAQLNAAAQEWDCLVRAPANMQGRK